MLTALLFGFCFNVGHSVVCLVSLDTATIPPLFVLLLFERHNNPRVALRLNSGSQCFSPSLKFSFNHVGVFFGITTGVPELFLNDYFGFGFLCHKFNLSRC